MLTQGTAYGDSLLPASAASELLPTNTQIYPTTVTYSRWFYLSAFIGGVVALALLGAAAAATGGGRGGLVGGAVAVL